MGTGIKSLIKPSAIKCSALALGIAALSFSTPALSAKSKKEKELEQFTIPIITEYQEIDIQDLAFRRAYFFHAQENNFRALNEILLFKALNHIPEDGDYANMLLGQLYTEWRMADAADATFQSIIGKNVLARTRNETWLHKAELQYRQGNLEEARKILENPLDLTPDLERKRRVVLSNIYIRTDKFNKATDILADVPISDFTGAYANFNLGVAQIRAGDIDDGVETLTRLYRLPDTEPELSALKDRAALAIGITYLQAERYNESREALVSVQLDGPYANQALLALGYANYSRNQIKKALPVWLELIKRNPADPVVQEALLLAPRAYADLGALPQALIGYRHATDIYREQLKKVEKTIAKLQDPKWLDQLSSGRFTHHYEANPMAEINYTPADTAEAQYLYKLFASHAFIETYSEYEELKQLENLLLHKSAQIPIYRNLLTQHRKEIGYQLPELERKLEQGKQRFRQLKQEYDDLVARSQGRNTTVSFLDNASPAQLILYNRIVRAEKRVKRLPSSSRYDIYRERLRRVKGVLLWNIAFNADANQQTAIQDIEAISFMLDDVQLKVSALEQTKKDLQYRKGLSTGNRLNDLQKSSRKLLVETRDKIKLYQIELRTLALKVLANYRVQLAQQLAEAHLATARIQDEEISASLGK